MASPNADGYTKNELANRCYEFMRLVEVVGQAFQGWQQRQEVAVFTGLGAAELDDRVVKLKDAFAKLADEKIAWLDGQKMTIPLHPRHNLKNEPAVMVTISRHDKGDNAHFIASIPRPQYHPLTFKFE